MGLSVSMRNDVWMDGVQVAGQDLRLQQAGAFLSGASPSGTTGIAARPGVRYGTGQPLQVNASSGMNLTVNPGVAWVQGSAAANAGMYTGCLDTAGTITVAGADPSNPRIDNVIVQVTDNGNSSSTTVVTLQTGVPGSSPSPPVLPANSLLLAQIAVAAGVTSITAANITDERSYTAATGGIVPMANTTGGISGGAGQYAHDLSSGRLRVSDGSGHATQPKTALFAPVSTGPTNWFPTGSYSATGGPSLSVTVDGFTEIEAIVTWYEIVHSSGTVGATDGIILGFGLNGSTSWPGGSLSSFAILVDPSGYTSGGTFRAWITPPAGTATINLCMGASGTGSYYIDATYFRVQANAAQ